MYIYSHVYTDTYIYIIHTYTFTHTHKHTHTQGLVDVTSRDTDSHRQYMHSFGTHIADAYDTPPFVVRQETVCLSHVPYIDEPRTTFERFTNHI